MPSSQCSRFPEPGLENRSTGIWGGRTFLWWPPVLIVPGAVCRWGWKWLSIMAAVFGPRAVNPAVHSHWETEEVPRDSPSSSPTRPAAKGNGCPGFLSAIFPSDTFLCSINFDFTPCLWHNTQKNSVRAAVVSATRRRAVQRATALMCLCTR